MKKLTTKNYWDVIYEQEQKSSVSVWKKIVASIKEFFGGSLDNYSEYIIWNDIYPKFLTKNKNTKIVEIGSAPGWNMVKFKQVYDYDPYGIEYSEAGAENNRRRFARADIDPNHVIVKDFFAEEIVAEYGGFFDIVLSGGFIEHFDDTRSVIGRHLDLLKPHGLVIITIPNFQGINKFFAKFFDEEIQISHNFSIMNKFSFEKCFEDLGLEKVYCDYYGTFYLGLFHPLGGKGKDLIYRFLVRLQIIFNLFFHTFFKGHHVESAYTSPYLIYIGRKK